MKYTADRLHIRCLSGNDPNYELVDCSPGKDRVLARVAWLNVHSTPMSFGGGAGDVAAEFGGTTTKVVKLANARAPADDGTRHAAGAYVTFEGE